jgi:hypothetical protein
MSVRIIKNDDLKTEVDLVCTNCGKEYDVILNIEGKDYVFETDEIDEWCICIMCREKIK